MKTVTGLLAALTLGTLSLPAAVVFYNSQAAFNLASSTTLRADFEGFSHANDTANPPDPYTEGGVTFFDPKNLFIATPGGAVVLGGGIQFPLTSNVLTVTFNEDITMTFGGAGPTAVGFSSFTNTFAAPVVTVFDTSNALIGTYTLTQGINSAGFVGITSSVAIGSVHWLATSGELKDTAIDNVYTGAAIPEPATPLLLACGLGSLAWCRRHFWPGQASRGKL